MDVDFTIRHPTDKDLVARYGYDVPRGGLWLEIVDGNVVVTVDATNPEVDVAWPVLSILEALAEWGFVASDDVFDAVTWLRSPAGCRPRLRRGVRTALRVLWDLESAAG